MGEMRRDWLGPVTFSKCGSRSSCFVIPGPAEGRSPESITTSDSERARKTTAKTVAMDSRLAGTQDLASSWASFGIILGIIKCRYREHPRSHPRSKMTILVPLEILHRALVPFCGGARSEGAEIAAPPGLRILRARIEPVFAGGKLADHGGSLAVSFWFKRRAGSRFR